MLDPFERVVGPAVSDAAERRPRRRRAHPDIGGRHDIEVRTRRAGGGGHMPELIDDELTHARHQSHRRIAARRGHAGSEEHQRER